VQNKSNLNAADGMLKVVEALAIDMNILIYKNNRVMINGKWAYHMFSTYGIPPECLEEMVTQRIKKWIQDKKRPKQ
jgi:alanyl-tRNA synthetase